ISLSLLGLILFASPRGLMSTNTSGVFGALKESSASRIRIRDIVTPFRGSTIGSPVVCRASSTADTVAAGELCFKISQAPAPCGGAIHVPLKKPKYRIGREEEIKESRGQKE